MKCEKNVDFLYHNIRLDSGVLLSMALKMIIIYRLLQCKHFFRLHCIPVIN